MDEIKQYENVPLIAQKLIEGFMTGLHKSPYHGFSAEYSEHRAYNEGESIRHIDWKVFAKTDKLYTKHYEEESNLRVYFLLDTSSSMYYPAPAYDKIRFAAWASMAMAYMFHKQRDAVGLFTFCEQIVEEIKAKTSDLHMRNLFALFEKLLQPPISPQKTDLPGVIHRVVKKIPKRSMLIIFTDLLQEHADTKALALALRHCQHYAHEVLLFHIMHEKTEKELQLDERPYLFRPLEGGKIVRVHPRQVQKDYQKKIAHYLQNMQHLCGKGGACYLPADVSEPFERIFFECIARRARMR